MPTKKNKLRAGKLLVVEGIDGSGKTTLIKKLQKKLKKKGHKVIVSEWRDSPIIGAYLKKMAEEKIKFCPHAFSALHAADFADRMANEILPALEAGKIVICDRYFYTEIVRDAGLNQTSGKWNESLFPFAPEPDLIIFLDVSLNTSLARVRKRIKKNGKPGSLNKSLQNITGSLIGSLDSTTGIMINSRYKENGDPMTDLEREKIKFSFQLSTHRKYCSIFGEKKNVLKIDAEEKKSTVLKSVLTGIKKAL